MSGLHARLRAYAGGHVYPLAGLLAGLVTFWLFWELADDVLEGDTQALDEYVVRLFRDPDDPGHLRGPSWLAQAARDVTALGGQTVLSLVCLAAVGFCLVVRRVATALLVIPAGAGGMLLTAVLKAVFDRPRPEVVPHLLDASLGSFPSGHAMASAAVYLSLAAVLAHEAAGHAAKLYIFGVALLLTGAVGVSRILLGVHYPTDVLAGWCVGLAWAVFCALGARYLRSRGWARERA